MRRYEGALASYMLKRRYSFVLADSKFLIGDTTAMTEAGGNIFAVLKYQVRTDTKMAVYSTLESVTTVCEHCLRLEETQMCSDIPQCLDSVDKAHHEMADDGRNVNWGYYRLYPYYPDPGRRRPGLYYCMKPEDGEHGGCTTSLEDALFNYITESLNKSVTGTSIHDIQRLTRPVVSWSEDNAGTEVSATNWIVPLDFYPMRSPDESVTSLKFITADGVHQRVPYFAVYTQPLDLTTWAVVPGLLLLLLAVVLMTTKSDNPRVDAGNVMRWGLFWLHSVLLDQVQFPRVRKARAGFRALINSLLLLAFILAFAVNIIYKSVLNVNYVTVNELICPWSRLDQLINFTALYIPTGVYIWNQLEHYHSYEKHEPKHRVALRMMYTCWSNLFQKEPIDEIFCMYDDEVGSAWTRASLRAYNSESCMDKMPEMLGVKAAEYPMCFDDRTIVLGRFFRLFQHFPMSALDTYVKFQMTQPGTALLVTESTFPAIWETFERAMVGDPSLRFSHNYFSATDRSVFGKRPSRLIVTAGMPESQSRLVTARVHNMLATGTWEMWVSMEICRKKKSNLERETLQAFAPISMNHDGFYVLLLMTGALTALSIVSLLAGICVTAMSKIVLPSRFTTLFRKPTKATKVHVLPSNNGRSRDAQ